MSIEDFMNLEDENVLTDVHVFDEGLMISTKHATLRLGLFDAATLLAELVARSDGRYLTEQQHEDMTAQFIEERDRADQERMAATHNRLVAQAALREQCAINDELRGEIELLRLQFTSEPATPAVEGEAAW